MHLWNQTYTRAELLRRVGDMSQIGFAQPFELADGVERGARCVRLCNAAGLDLTVTTDRGMGLAALSYRGVPVPFMTAGGVSHPAYAEHRGTGWLRTWPGGFLTPAGLTQAGAPCRDGDEELGMHGRISNLPARNVSWGAEWQGEEYVLWAQGSLRETAMFGENLELTRRIWMRLDEPRFRIEDRVENHGFAPAPLMFLQHINLGFPLVDASTRLELPEHATQPRDAAAEPGMETCLTFEAPQAGVAEQVFYHDLIPDAQGMVEVRLANPAFDGGRGLGVALRYARADYPVLVEWKLMAEGSYVVGLEPANCHTGGRCQERQAGTLQTLPAQETRTFALEVSLL